MSVGAAISPLRQRPSGDAASSHLSGRTPATQFQDGESVCFIGDSITHNGGYWSNIALFYATRFPARRIAWHNRGISGDWTSGTLHRFDWDIAPCRPDVAVILLGMNDVGRDLYGDAPVDEDTLARRRQHILDYTVNLAGLAQRLQALETRLVLLTPSIYDQTATIAARNHRGVDDALARCAEAVRTLAETTGAAWVDLHGPMGELNGRLQADDPTQSIIGADRVHPEACGELVMAHLLLTAQGIRPIVARMDVDAAAGRILAQQNCVLSQLSAQPTELRFSCVATALPFPITEAQLPALAMVPFTESLNQETLRITGLNAGMWQVRIDQQVIATCRAEELSAGINLAANILTPQHRQASRVASRQQRIRFLTEELRTIATLFHKRLVPAGVAPGDLEAGRAKLLHLVEHEPDDWLREQMQRHLTDRPSVEGLRAQRSALMNLMRCECMPSTHAFEVSLQS